MPKPDDVGVGTALIILNEAGEILLGQRKGAHKAGTFCVPGGWMDRPDETTEASCIREAVEEIGLDIHSVVRFDWTTEDHEEIGARTVTLYHLAGPNSWNGEPKLMEPEKNEGWGWYSINAILNSPGPFFPGLLDMIYKLDDEWDEWTDNLYRGPS